MTSYPYWVFVKYEVSVLVSISDSLKVSVSEGVVLVSKGLVSVLDGQISVLVSVSDFEAETPLLNSNSIIRHHLTKMCVYAICIKLVLYIAYTSICIAV